MASRDGKTKRLTQAEIKAKEIEQEKIAKHRAMSGGIHGAIKATVITQAKYAVLPHVKKPYVAIRDRWKPPVANSDEALEVVDHVWEKRLRFVNRQQVAYYKGGTVAYMWYDVIDSTNLALLPGESPVELYHGTSAKAFGGILCNNNFVPSKNGLLGAGLYLGGRSKAEHFLKCDVTKDNLSLGGKRIMGVLLHVQAALGVTKQATGKDFKKWTDCDTLYGVKGVTPTYTGTLYYDEWCIRKPQGRIKLIRAAVILSNSK